MGVGLSMKTMPFPPVFKQSRHDTPDTQLQHKASGIDAQKNISIFHEYAFVLCHISLVKQRWHFILSRLSKDKKHRYLQYVYMMVK
jgi:hypothetical protein